MKTVAVTGSFDNLRSKHVRFLQEASKRGNVQVGLWSDETLQDLDGSPPNFPEQERSYLLRKPRPYGLRPPARREFRALHLPGNIA